MAKTTNIKQQIIKNDNELVKFIKMVIIVAVLFLAFYLITVQLNKKDKKTETPKAEIQYEQILIGNIFTQNDGSYYVLIKENGDLNVKLYESYLNLYKEKKDAKNVYHAILNNPLNNKFKDENNNITNDIATLKLSTTTLFYIEDGKISKSYTNKEEMVKVLAEISKTET